MSYEGYVQKLCKNGHLWAEGCYDDSCLPCEECGELPVWEHSVDCTNGVEKDENGVPYPGTIPYPLKVDHYEDRVIRVPIYKVPPK